MTDPPNPKRHRGYNQRGPAPPKKHGPSDEELLQSNNPFMPMFLNFRHELDEHHDRRERVIKTSRDVTALSKKMIFSMQRARQLATPLPSHVASETSQRQDEINELLTTISPDLQSLNAYRYANNISGGLQELMEALCFRHYLTTGSILSYKEACSAVPGGINLTVSDYVLGVFDFVGEVMRFGITMVALTSREENGAERILMDLRRLREEFEGLDTFGHSFLGKEVDKKMTVMKTCVEKVENAVYGVIVRGSEKPKGWVPDLSERREPEDFGYNDE